MTTSEEFDFGGWNKVASNDQILAAVRSYTEEHGFCPSIRDLAREVGIKSPSAMKYRVDRLRENGYLSYDPKIPRTIRLTEKGRKCL